MFSASHKPQVSLHQQQSNVLITYYKSLDQLLPYLSYPIWFIIHWYQFVLSCMMVSSVFAKSNSFLFCRSTFWPPLSLIQFPLLKPWQGRRVVGLWRNVSNLKSTMDMVHDAIYCLPLGDIKVHYSSWKSESFGTLFPTFAILHIQRNNQNDIDSLFTAVHNVLLQTFL